MAGLLIKIEDASLQAKLAKLQAGLADASPLMREWGKIAMESINYAFEVGGHPKRWKPLALATIKIKGHTRALIGKSGNLARIAVKPEALRVLVGPSPSAKAYAAIQHLGGKAGRGRKVTIPARPYLQVTEADVREMQEAGVLYLRKLSA